MPSTGILLGFGYVERGRDQGLNGRVETATEMHSGVEIGGRDGVFSELHEVLKGGNIVSHGPSSLIVAHTLQHGQRPGHLIDRAEALDESFDKIKPHTEDSALGPVDLPH